MIVFSLQKNKNWSGTGTSIKPSAIELSSSCFIEQDLLIVAGKYNGKIIGSSISGNGIYKLSITTEDDEILSKTFCLKNKINTECSFQFEISYSQNCKIKIWRDRDCIGRINLNLFSISKLVEKTEQIQPVNTKEVGTSHFFVIDYDLLNGPTDINKIFPFANKFGNVTFLLKVTDSFVSSGPNYRLFFEWGDLFDFIELFQKNKIIYMEGNVDPSIFKKYNVNVSLLEKIKQQVVEKTKISGFTF